MAALQKMNHYLSLVKFSHTVFALPFALIGFTLGVSKRIGQWDAWFQNTELFFLLLKIVLCMVFARNAAMGFNRYLDADIDAKNQRTALREVPAGIISKKNARIFVLINCMLFIGTTFFINQLCFLLSPVALFVILFYSYTKRFTALCHLVLGVGLSLAPIGAYLAVRGCFDWLPILFSCIVFTWVSGFDILYALQDEDFDAQYKLHSIPVLLGRKHALSVSRLLHLITGAVVLFAGYYGGFASLYWIGGVAFITLLIYQHTLIKVDDISKINLAFGTTNGIASVTFALFVIADILLLSYTQ